MSTQTPIVKFAVSLDFFLNMTLNATPQSVYTYSDVFAANDVATYSNEELTRLLMYFNLFQEWRMERIHWHYKPYLHGAPNPTAMAVYQSVATPSNALMFYYQWFGEDSEYVVLFDKDDVLTRPVIDEYWQARVHPSAMCKKTWQEHSCDVFPYVPDAIAETQPVGSGTALNPTSSATQAVTTIASSTGNPQLNLSTPQRHPWMATKALSAVAGYAYQANWHHQLYGLKMWFYLPYNNLGASIGPIAIARISEDYHYEFRNPDYRLLITNAGMEKELADGFNLEELKKIYGDKIQLAPKRRKVELIQADGTTVTNSAQFIDRPTELINTITKSKQPPPRLDIGLQTPLKPVTDREKATSSQTGPQTQGKTFPHTR